MLKILSSVKLTLLLLLLLAFLAIGGTITPVEAQRYELFYQSPWFRSLLGLLALNLICCTIKTLPSKWHYRRQLREALAAGGNPGRELSAPLPRLEQKLVAAGYRVTVVDELLLAERGSFARWGAPLVHIAILLIMFGGLLGEAGFVGTINTYLQQPNDRYFDWDSEQEQELGFQFRVDDFRLRYYPIQLRFELLDLVSGNSHGLLMLFDNESFAVPGTALVGQLRGFDPDDRLLTIDVLEQGQLIGQYQIGDKIERFGHVQYPSFRLRNLEFRDPVLKQMEADVSLLEAGALVKKGTIRVNEPLTYRGVSIYQTAYGRDEFGNRSVGFQLSKDPGEALVWFSTVVLMLGFALAFFVPRRAVGIKTVNGQPHLFALQGWRGDAGRERLGKLYDQLGA